MLEPQSKLTGEELIRPGWITFDEIAKFLNDWTTKEQRECGEQLLILHSGDLPPDLDSVVEESRRYMDEIMRRLSPQAAIRISIIACSVPGSPIRLNELREGRRASLVSPDAPDTCGFGAPPKRSRLSNVATALQEKMFGLVPLVRRTHPLWLDTAEVAAQLSAGAARVAIASSGSAPRIRFSTD